jgi:pyrroloquinoline quinone biosynthesis protein E
VGWALRNRAALMPTRAQVEASAAAVAAARARGEDPPIDYVLPDYFQGLPKPCVNGWGRTSITVTPDGAALPCAGARAIAGLEAPSVRDRTLADVWFRSEAFTRFRGTDWMPEPCRSCARRTLDHGGCRCQAFALTGDAAATDPACRWSPHHDRVLAAIDAAAPGIARAVHRGGRERGANRPALGADAREEAPRL